MLQTFGDMYQRHTYAEDRLWCVRQFNGLYPAERVAGVIAGQLPVDQQPSGRGLWIAPRPVAQAAPSSSHILRAMAFSSAPFQRHVAAAGGDPLTLAVAPPSGHGAAVR